MNLIVCKKVFLPCFHQQSKPAKERKKELTPLGKKKSPKNKSANNSLGSKLYLIGFLQQTSLYWFYFCLVNKIRIFSMLK